MKTYLDILELEALMSLKSRVEGWTLGLSKCLMLNPQELINFAGPPFPYLQT